MERFVEPTISIVNTYFNNPYGENNFYSETAWSSNNIKVSPKWETCSSSNNLCVEYPFTGSCNLIKKDIPQLGVICNYNPNAVSCLNGFFAAVNTKLLPPLNVQVCNKLKKCDTSDEIEVELNGTSTTDTVCKGWDCVSTTNTGSFTRLSNCTIIGMDHVSVVGTLEIVGNTTDMNNLVTITAATNKRHFAVNDANDRLILRYLSLVGGDV